MNTNYIKMLGITQETRDNITPDDEKWTSPRDIREYEATAIGDATEWIIDRLQETFAKYGATREDIKRAVMTVDSEGINIFERHARERLESLVSQYENIIDDCTSRYIDEIMRYSYQQEALIPLKEQEVER